MEPRVITTEEEFKAYLAKCGRPPLPAREPVRVDHGAPTTTPTPFNTPATDPATWSPPVVRGETHSTTTPPKSPSIRENPYKSPSRTVPTPPIANLKAPPAGSKTTEAEEFPEPEGLAELPIEEAVEDDDEVAVLKVVAGSPEVQFLEVRRNVQAIPVPDHTPSFNVYMVTETDGGDYGPIIRQRVPVRMMNPTPRNSPPGFPAAVIPAQFIDLKHKIEALMVKLKMLCENPNSYTDGATLWTAPAFQKKVNLMVKIDRARSVGRNMVRNYMNDIRFGDREDVVFFMESTLDSYHL
jgi:hypothetical protein